MILNKIKIENFKKINNLEISLANINILVGANGAGKSSVLQALHLACCTIRQAPEIRSNKTSTIDIQNLDYLPTDDYKLLGHNCRWGNSNDSPGSKVSFEFKNNQEIISASCTLRSARNAGISITGNVPTQLSTALRNNKQYFSAYIPGISGIPNKEEKKSKKVILKSSSFGDSNVILRNILLLLKETNPSNINTIEKWLEPLIGTIRFDVSHDDERDLFIKCNFSFIDSSGMETDKKPIELLGSGYLQLLQIFCYILLFKPKLLLIDEPDIHLHPNIQENLISSLANIIHDSDDEFSMKIILTTHSPFIIRGATEECKVFWVDGGTAQVESRDVVAQTLGWGIFDKKILILTEDSNLTLLKKLLAQWPQLQTKVAILPGNGYANIPTPEQAEQFKNFLGNKYQIIVHRDRDSFTQEEVNRLKDSYQEKGISLWIPTDSDVESYFCGPVFLYDLFKNTQSENFDSEASTKLYIDSIIASLQTIAYDQFKKQRKANNDELYKDGGGSPRHDDIWQILQNERPLKGIKGKTLFNKLKDKLQSKPCKFELESIENHSMEVVIAEDLKELLESLITT